MAEIAYDEQVVKYTLNRSTNNQSGEVIDASSGATALGNTLIVAKSGGQYSTIQSAINASSSGDTILIYDGVYEENIVTTAGNSIALVGVGTMGSVVIQANTGTVLTVPSMVMSMAFIKNLKLKSTSTGINGSQLFKGSGLMTSFNNVTFDYNISDGYTAKIVEMTNNGSFIFSGCKFDFDSTGTHAGVSSFITADSAVRFNIMQGFGTMSTAAIASSTELVFMTDNSSGTNIIRDFDCTIEAITASFAGEMDFLHSTNIDNPEILGNKISITTPSGVVGSLGHCYHLSGTGGGDVHSSSNRINVLGFETNSLVNIGATETLTSHFDDIVAAQGVTGAGTYSYVNSPSNGNLQMSGDIISKVIDITTDYDASEAWKFGILNSNATSEITATFNTTEINSLPNGAKRTFINSSSASNLILDVNGISVGNSTSDRAIYPNGYITIEKIGSSFIISNSYNTSFNINLSDVANKTFHLDFSDVSSVTTSGDDITSMTESINSWSGDGTVLAGRVKYGLTTQNGLNTGLWNASNSALNFGDRDLHSNLTGRGLTIIAVIKPTYSGDAIISKYADNVPNAEWRFLTNSAVIYDELDRSGNEATLNFSSNYTEWQLIGMTWEANGRLSVYKNGFLMGTSSYGTVDIPAGTADLQVGISDISGMDYYGEIGEIIAISDTPTQEMREALVSKLGAKWGIDVAVFSASDSSPFGRNEETTTIKPLIDNDNLNIGTGVFSGVIEDGTALETSAAPTTDAGIANKKYVDDSVGMIPYTPVTASRAVAITDFGKGLAVNSSSAVVITLPLNTTVALPIFTVIPFSRLGTGTVQVIGEAGTTVNTKVGGGNYIKEQYGEAYARKIDADTWIFTGDTEAGA